MIVDQALVGLVADRAGGERDQQADHRGRQDPLDVEVEDRPPGRMALVEDLLAGMQLRRHWRQSIPAPAPSGDRPAAAAPRPPPALACGAMPIARVEPLTTARALRGPYDYRLPERLGDGRGRDRCSRCRSGTSGCSASWSSSPSAASCRRRGWSSRSAALEAGVPPELVRLGLWVAREYCSTPARGLELVLPPGTTGAGGQTRGADRDRRERDRGRGRGARRAAGWAGPAAGARAAGRGRRPARWTPPSSPPTASAATPCARLERRGLVRARQAPGPPPAALRRRSAPRPAGSSSTRPSAPRSSGSSRRSTATGTSELSCSCTGSPARARPRSTWPPPRRRSSGGGA